MSDPYAAIAKPGEADPYAAIAVRAAAPAAKQTNRVETSAGGAAIRHAGRGTAPALAGAAGFGAGFATAGTLATPVEAVPIAGPFLHVALALGGGLAGAFGAGYVVDRAQDKVLSMLPNSLVKALGQDEPQRQADEAEHPYASFAGQLAPQILTMRPGMGGSVPLRIASKTVRVPGAAVGAGLGGATEAATELANGQKPDLTKIGISSVVGAALNRPTAVGSKLFQAGGNTAIRAMQGARGAVDNARYTASKISRFGQQWNDRRTGKVIDGEWRVIPQKQIAGPVAADPYANIAKPVAPVAPVAPKAPLRPVSAPVAAPAPAPPVVAPLPVAATPAAAVSDGQGTAAPDGDPLRPHPGELGEGERMVRTPAGASVRTRMGVVDASQLVQAEGANQNRDRSRDATSLQVQDIISKFDPELLHEDPSSDRGAPIVGPDNAIDSGNGRVLALNGIYDQHPELAQKYRSMIEARGLSTEGMDRPILVQHRVTDMTPEQRRQFVIDSNKDTKLELSPVERARSDADSISPEMLAKFEGGDLNSTANAAFVQEFNKRLTTAEMGNMLDENRRLSTVGAQRIENAVLAHAYDKPKLLSRMMESSQDDIRAITGSLADVAGPWARMRQAAKSGEIGKQYDITDQLADAAARVSDARKSGTKPADLLSQIDAFDQLDPVAAELIRAFHNPQMTRTPVQIAKDLLAQRDNPNGEGLALEPSPKEKINEANGPTQRDEGRDAGKAQEGPRRRGEGRAEAVTESRGGRGEEGLAEDTPDYAADRPSYVEDRGPYDPEFATLSFTNRASIFTSAAEALGIDPDKFTLMPAPRQMELLQQAMLDKYGVAITVDRGMQERFAIDQMLDAYQNVQGMAHVLDLPAKAISLGGKLKLQFVGKAGFLGAYSPGKEMIILPRRSNSFAHEWAHALDWHLLETGEPGRGLSGAIRERGGAAETIAPTNVREAFVDLLNAMFFDKAAAAHAIMEHEVKIAQTKSEKVKATAQAAIDRLTAGNSQAKGIRSAFYNNAKVAEGPSSEYWTSPTEMFARAFEAYTSYKVEAAGLTTEFIGKGDAGYLSNAEERFAKTFPKGEERARIFAAFEEVFGHMADEQVLAKGKGAERPAGGTRRISDLDKTPPKVMKEKGIIAREITAIKRSVEQAKKEAAARPDDAKGWVEKAADLNGVTFMSMAGNLRMIQARSGSRSLQKLIDQLTYPDGKGDRTVSRTFHEDVHLQSKQAINRLGNVLKAHGIEHRSAAEDMMLRDLLVGAREDGPANYVKGAAAIRRILDNEFYVNQQAGIDLGYTRNGYLARVLDLPKVYHDQPGFARQATKVYELVYDKEFGTDPAKLLADDEKRPDFFKLAGFLASKGADLPSFAEARSLLKQITQLSAKAAKSDEPDAINAQIAKLQADLEDVFAELHGEVRTPYAAERAEAWLAKINLVAGQEHNASSPDSKYTKHRELPPEADKLMEQFYLSDPVESVTNYLVTSARRTAYARRFGADGKKRLAMFEGMAAEGVSPADQRTVERILDTATGRVRSQLPDALQTSLSFINAAGTMALLPRAAISSLAEPFTAGLVTGDARDGFKMLSDIIGGALGSPSGKVRFELSRAMGIVSNIASDDIMESRYGQTYADSTRWDRYTATMFTRTGLTGLTRAQKTHGIGLGHAFLDNLAQTVAKGGKGPAVANATALLRELGVRNPEAFSKELVGTNRMPTVEELESPYGQDYTTAQLRFSRLVVQEPNQIDRPELAANPVGRVIYGITGFSYSYWRNIVKRNGILIKQMYGRDKGRAALYGGALFAAAAVAYAMGLTISTIREKLLNPKRWDELKEKGELESQMAQLGFTRTFSFGAADVAIQTWSGLKYQRDLSNAFVGAGPGFFLQNAQKISKLGVANSRKTNTAEYNAIQGAYSTASPFIAFGLARIPGGPVLQTATGAGMAYVTSPNARDAVAEFAVGKKNTPKVRTPTRYDKFLDGAFGPKVQKKRE